MVTEDVVGMEPTEVEKHSEFKPFPSLSPTDIFNSVEGGLLR